MFTHKISSHFSLVEGQPMHSSWALKHDAIFLKISRRLLVPEQWFPQCYKILFLQVSHLHEIAGANSIFQGEYSHAHFLSDGRPSHLNNQMLAHLVTLLTSLNETYLELCWPVGILGKSELNYFSVFLLLRRGELDLQKGDEAALIIREKNERRREEICLSCLGSWSTQEQSWAVTSWSRSLEHDTCQPMINGAECVQFQAQCPWDAQDPDRKCYC